VLAGTVTTLKVAYALSTPEAFEKFEFEVEDYIEDTGLGISLNTGKILFFLAAFVFGIILLPINLYGKLKNKENK